MTVATTTGRIVSSERKRPLLVSLLSNQGNEQKTVKKKSKLPIILFSSTWLAITILYNQNDIVNVDHRLPCSLVVHTNKVAETSVKHINIIIKQEKSTTGTDFLFVRGISNQPKPLLCSKQLAVEIICSFLFFSASFILFRFPFLCVLPTLQSTLCVISAEELIQQCTQVQMLCTGKTLLKHNH